MWDCHLQLDAGCSLNALPCAWPQLSDEVAEAPARQVSEAGAPTRFVTWNLYVFTLAGRSVDTSRPRLYTPIGLIDIIDPYSRP